MQKYKMYFNAKILALLSVFNEEGLSGVDDPWLKDPVFKQNFESKYT